MSDDVNDWSVWEVNQYLIAARSKAEAVGVFELYAFEVYGDSRLTDCDVRDMRQIGPEELVWLDCDEDKEPRTKQVPARQLLEGASEPKILLYPMDPA